MDERIAIWNVLHDGEITAVSRSGSAVTFFVSIGYLRRRFAPPGGCFALSLGEVSELHFHDFDGEVQTLEQQFETGRLDILGTESQRLPIVVDTSMGSMTLSFERFDLSLDTGQLVSFAEIDQVSDEYWRDWEGKRLRGEAS
ncbi:hypothetical protein ACG04Q_19190 [Roseateles sp. DXS20W]|uniref:Uncharacterized protein n=1 Tax=Pelomonas lactea TaxID=3299030 RepID=A0ABW7GP27_9BURK